MLKIIIKPQLKKVWYWYMNIQYKKIKDQKKNQIYPKVQFIITKPTLHDYQQWSQIQTDHHTHRIKYRM